MSRGMENHEILNTMMIVLSKFKLTLGGVFTGATTLLLAVLTNSALLIGMVYVMIGVHVLTGFAVAVHDWWQDGTKPKFDDTKFFKTAMKFVWFPIVIGLTSMVKNGFGLDDIPLTRLAAGYIVVHDLKGIFDNVFKLTGIDFWDAIGEILKEKFQRKDQ